MPRARRAKNRGSIPVLTPEGRHLLFTPEQVRAWASTGHIVKGHRGGWVFAHVYQSALKQAKGRVMKRATKPPWNGGGVSGGGIFRVRPRRDDETRAMQAAERVFQGAKRDLIDELTT